MKFFQSLFVIFLSFLAVALAQEGAPDCEATCNERIQPIVEEKNRAEEWGRGLQQEVEELRNRLGQAEGHSNELRTLAENAQRELEEAKGRIDQVRNEGGQALSRAETELSQALDKIARMESSRISVNVNGIKEDLKGYWQKLLSWWTGLTQPKGKDEDL